MNWYIKSFLQVFCTAMFVIIFSLAFCGGLMFLVDFTFDAFIAGVVLGLIFGLPLIIISIVHIVHSFYLIFNHD